MKTLRIVSSYHLQVLEILQSKVTMVIEMSDYSFLYGGIVRVHRYPSDHHHTSTEVASDHSYTRVLRFIMHPWSLLYTCHGVIELVKKRIQELSIGLENC